MSETKEDFKKRIIAELLELKESVIEGGWTPEEVIENAISTVNENL